jgi:hypothetical protein
VYGRLHYHSPVAATQGMWQDAQSFGQARLTRLEPIGYDKAEDVRQWLAHLQASTASRKSRREEC